MVLFSVPLEFNLNDLLFCWEKREAVYRNTLHATAGDHRGCESSHVEHTLKGKETRTKTKQRSYLQTLDTFKGLRKWCVAHKPTFSTFSFWLQKHNISEIHSASVIRQKNETQFFELITFNQSLSLWRTLVPEKQRFFKRKQTMEDCQHIYQFIAILFWTLPVD
jgi:hypothetical protein